MDLRLTLVDARGQGRCVDLEVCAPEQSSLRDLLGAVPEALVPGAPAYDWYAGGSLLAPDAPLGVPPLVDGAFVTNEAGELGSSRPARGLLELHVVEGPDCGRIVRLTPGSLRIGRSSDADLPLHDPTLSRVHVELVITHDGLRLRDLGTTNGTFLDGSRLRTDAEEPVQPGQRIRLGATTVVLRVPRLVTAGTRPDGRGHLSVNRGPRERITLVDNTIRMPAAPEAAEPLRAPVLTMVLPLVLSAGVALALHSPTMLLFGLMGPVMLLGSHLSDRRGRHRGSRRRQREHAEALARAQEELQSALDLEARQRRRQSPDLAALMNAAQGPAATVWHRRRHDPDFLQLRVGSGTLPAALTVLNAPNGRAGPFVQDRAESHPLLIDVPICVALQDAGVLGVAGPRQHVLGSARGLIAQVCGWHSPRDVGLVILVDEPAGLDDWGWATWLPHTRGPGGPGGTGAGRPRAWPITRIAVRPDGGEQLRERVGELTALVDERLAARQALDEESKAGPAVVVVLDGARQLRSRAGLGALLERGPSVGVFFVCLDTQLQRLPVETGASFCLSEQGTTGSCRRQPEDEAVSCTPGLFAATWAEHLARALAPLRDATPQQDLAEPPEDVRLLDVLPVDATDPTAVARLWRSTPRTTSCTIGLGAAGPQLVDLQREGPHALVGGTTGSGKSELLQTMIASLAIGNRPDEMVFVLVDYKGGSAFKDCARLPHTVGMVTDLDGHLTERALTSLGAELKRREQLLSAAGAKDLEDYQRLSSAMPPIPRLVLVIDEFRMLAEELPDFLAGLVRIATVGRSLGVHLILATQRPGGVVSADIRANVNLRIALRVRDKSDSDDVIEAPDAAAISERTPGRAMMRSAGNPLQLFQSARVGGHALMVADEPVRVRPFSPLAADGPAPADAAAAGDSATDLANIVEAVCAARDLLQVPAVASPWLPALTGSPTLPQPAENTWQLPYAVADVPAEQRQPWVIWDLERDGHLACAGSARSGRTTLARTLAGSLAERCSPDAAHLYVFDGSGALHVLAGLPHTGAVVARDESARGDRLLQRLLGEIGRRQAAWADHGYSSLAEQRGTAAGEPGTEALPYLVVFVDGWELFTQTYEDVDHGRPVEAMLRILREGQSVGVRVVVTGDRSVLLSRLASLMPDRICLRMADEADLLLAGLSATSLPARMPPGRAVRVLDGVELQVAMLDTGSGDDPCGVNRPGHHRPGEDPCGNNRPGDDRSLGNACSDGEWAGAGRVSEGSGRSQVLALQRIVERCRERASREPCPVRPLRVDSLPRAITLAEVRVLPLAKAPAPATAPATARAPGSVVLGVGGDDLAAICLPQAAPGLSFLVAGPAGSGRTTALALIAGQLADQGRTVIAVAETGAALLDRLPGRIRRVDPGDHGTLSTAAHEHADLLAIVDDAEQLAGAPAEDVLVELVRSARRTGGGVVCSGTVHELLGTFRGLTVEIRRQQTGILLNPSAPTDGELFGVRLTRCGQPVPGRGVLVTRGRLTDLQVATPDP